MTNRKEWKNLKAQDKYGSSYEALCGDRKRVIDQMFILHELELEEKKTGCR